MVYVCGTLLMGKDVQPLQSVKLIRIAMSMVLVELWFGHIASVYGRMILWCELILEVSGSCAVSYCGRGVR
jgi:hypothetical protein